MDIPSPEEPPWGRSAVVKGENKTEKGLVFALHYSYGQIVFNSCIFKICLEYNFLVTSAPDHYRPDLEYFDTTFVRGAAA